MTSLFIPQYWLLKSEPETWSWTDQKREIITSWDGVRNFQAAQNLKAMRVGDLAFFYHSGSERKIVGIVQIVKPYYPDPTDPKGRFGMVDVSFQEEIPFPISLKEIKQEPLFQNLALIRQSRLSVMPIDPVSWENLNRLGHQKPISNPIE